LGKRGGLHPLPSSSHKVLTSKKEHPGHFNLKKKLLPVLLPEEELLPKTYFLCLLSPQVRERERERERENVVVPKGFWMQKQNIIHFALTLEEFV
jgi:hypothetical protein